MHIWPALRGEAVFSLLLHKKRKCQFANVLFFFLLFFFFFTFYKREEDFSDLTGVDYSEGAIQLARDVAKKEGITDIDFKVIPLSELYRVDFSLNYNLCVRTFFLTMHCFMALQISDLDNFISVL